MCRLILLTIITTFCIGKISSQDSKNDSLEINETKYRVFLPSNQLIKEIEIELRTRNAIISLKTHPRVILNEEQYKTFSKILDTLQYLKNVVIIDSSSIILKSGLSWNLEGDPPSQPKNFYRKVFTEKGRKDKAVMDRLKYLQFCYAWKENGELPKNLVDKFSAYFLVTIDGVKQIEISFDEGFDPNGQTEIIKKEINFYTN